jgi:preprotein translocase subunit YajC
MSGGILLLIVIGFGLVWLFLIRPARRRQTQQMTMQEDLAVGDEIVTAGGVYGHVTEVDEDEVLVEIAKGVVVRVARRAVAGIIPPDEPEEDEPAEESDADEEAPAQQPENAVEAKLEPR